MTSKLTLPPDWEQKQVDIARRVLDDIPKCRGAEFACKWVDDPAYPRSKVPLLIITFPLALGLLHPAFGIRLSTFPSNALLEGWKLRDHIRRGAEAYLLKNGVRLDDEEVTIRVVA